MKKYKLLYDRSVIELNIPAKNIAHYIDLKKGLYSGNNLDKLNHSINSSVDPKLDQFVKNKKVGVIFADYTRKICFDEVIHALFKHLHTAFSLKVFIATGTHDGENKGNYHIVDLIKSHCNRFHLPLDRVIIHNCHAADFYHAGTTSNGNKIYVNNESKDVDLFVTHSDMKNHYFAGYSNALKNFFPGICKYESIEKNHALALEVRSTFGRHPLHPIRDRRDNPLAQDIWEGYQLITAGRPVYLLATIMKQDRIIWSEAGFLEKVTPKAIEQIDRIMSIKVNPADHIVVCCGGYPNDESLYTAQRALELTKNGVKKNGDILFIAACINGIGTKKAIQNFYEPLKNNLVKALHKYQDHYVMFSHKAYKFVQLIQRMRNIYLYSTLSPEQVHSIHLTPVNNVQEIIDSWIKENPQVKINIFPEGNKFAVYEKRKM
jgi:nickel-dependent lactate racemase